MSVSPNFIGIGAQKCASTWLFDIIDSHPQTALSSEKELDFFSRYFDFGYQWYERNFEGCEGEAIGEISPSYFNCCDAPKRVREYAPDAKILLSLRHPLERALSNHRHDVRIGLLTGDDLSLQAALQNNPNYVDQGLYARHLRRWQEAFPPEQLLVVLMDEIILDAPTTAKRVYEFLGIDTEHRSPALDARSNESYVNRSAKLETIKNRLRGSLQAMGGDKFWQWLGDSGLKDWYRRYNRMPSSAVIPSPTAVELERLQDCFAADLRDLSALLPQDLPPWDQLPAKYR